MWGCVRYAVDLRGHSQIADPDKLGQAGITAWRDLTADIKQLADIARAENPEDGERLTVVWAELAQRLSRRTPAANAAYPCQLKSERSAATSGPRSSFSGAAELPNCKPLPAVPAAVVGADSQAVVVSVNRCTNVCN